MSLFSPSRPARQQVVWSRCNHIFDAAERGCADPHLPWAQTRTSAVPQGRRALTTSCSIFIPVAGGERREARGLLSQSPAHR